MRILLAIVTLFLLMFLTQRLVPEEQIHPGSAAILALGFTMAAAYLFGRVISRWQLPKITGYLLAGVLVGPYFINLLSARMVRELQLIDLIALSLIALTAGGEFQIPKIRRQWKQAAAIIGWQLGFMLLGMTGLVLLSYFFVPFLQPLALPALLGVGLLVGVLSMAFSPATTIAVITETRSRGPLTDLVLSITIAIDILVVLVFAVVLAFAEPLIIPDKPIRLQYLLSVFGKIVFSLSIGAVVGGVISLYIEKVKSQVFLFLLGMILLTIELSILLDLKIILVFLMAGFIVENFSRHGEHLIKTIEEDSLIIYVVFFAIAGAALNFSVVLGQWQLVLLIVITRMAIIYGGTRLGAGLTGGSTAIRRYSWMGFVGQAGIALGLAIIVEGALPGEIGMNLKNIIIGVIALNQIIGPVLLRYALVKSREASP